jgi:hypothetical protein
VEESFWSFEAQSEETKEEEKKEKENKKKRKNKSRMSICSYFASSLNLSCLASSCSLWTLFVAFPAMC